MKNILTLVLISISGVLSAQAYFDAGVKAFWGPTFMYNKNILDDRTYDHQFSTGYSFGGKVGMHWGNHGVTFDYMNATSKQDFLFTYMDTRDNVNNYTWTHHDLLLMYRYSTNGVYIEIGPKYSLMSDVQIQFLEFEESSVKEMFVERYPSAVFGFGAFLAGSDVFTIQLGMRLHWGLADMISEEGKENNYPTIDTYYDTYTSTIPVAAQIGIEFNYAFGRLAKETCGGRKKLILFN